MKLLIIGHARHGKDTLAEILSRELDLTFKSSSEMASELFIYEALKDKYNYKSASECFEDRKNRRKEWHDLIAEYNKYDKARLAKEILKRYDIYVGMRSNEEIEKCRQKGLFDLVIGVYDSRKPHEMPDSFNIDFWAECDVVFPNSGTIQDLENRIKKVLTKLKQRKVKVGL